jgi:hypothetical protein
VSPTSSPESAKPDLPIGTQTVFADGKTYSVGVFTTQPADDTGDNGSYPGRVLTLSAGHLLRDVSPHLRRSHARARRGRVQTRPTGRHEARPAGKTTRRVGASSTTSGSDPGDDQPDEAGPPPTRRRCQACGADISHRRVGARTCDDLCRKALSRGKTAASAPAVLPSGRLEDWIEAVAWQRHLAWTAPDVPPRVGNVLTLHLEGLYADLRRQRARARVNDFVGRSGTVGVLDTRSLLRPWADTQGAYRRRQETAA